MTLTCCLAFEGFTMLLWKLLFILLLEIKMGSLQLQKEKVNQMRIISLFPPTHTQFNPN